jgi:hypothetical protein
MASGSRANRSTSRSAPPLRLACWSGPRNVSTAMMRAWGNRPDCAVIDEPFYAVYLAETGLEHPGRDEIIATGETDWRRVVTQLTGPIPDGKRIWYQKHMSHHLLPEIGRDWLRQLTHCFLIRDPHEVLLSYSKKRMPESAEDLGYPQQAEIFDLVCERDEAPPVVIDARDFLRAPEGMLRAWCERLGLDFCDSMLGWPPGRRETDGVWAPHWYSTVERSAGFHPYQAREEELPAEFDDILAGCLPHYVRLHAHRLKPVELPEPAKAAAGGE